MAQMIFDNDSENGISTRKRGKMAQCDNCGGRFIPRKMGQKTCGKCLHKPEPEKDWRRYVNLMGQMEDYERELEMMQRQIVALERHYPDFQRAYHMDQHGIVHIPPPRDHTLMDWVLQKRVDRCLDCSGDQDCDGCPYDPTGFYKVEAECRAACEPGPPEQPPVVTVQAVMGGTGKTVAVLNMYKAAADYELLVKCQAREKEMVKKAPKGSIRIAREPETLPEYPEGKCKFCGGPLPMGCPKATRYCSTDHRDRYREATATFRSIDFDEFIGMVKRVRQNACDGCGKEGDTQATAIKAVKEGGGEFDHENYRLLCADCMNRGDQK